MAKILIVDDSALARTMLKRILENLNHEVVGEAESGEQAILKYRRFSPDIITMDIVMGGISGIETAQRIKNHNPDAKIIVVTSHEENDLKQELIKNGLMHLVVKPVDEVKVSEALQSILNGSGSNINTDDTANKKLKADMHKFLKDVEKRIGEKKST